MKPINYKFQWFEKEDGRKSLRASVSRDGKLRLGRSLREKLPQFIQIGFDSDAMVLAIADGHGSGISCPACGVLTAQTLSAQISSTGLHLPVSFLMAQDDRTGYLLGRIVLRRKADESGKPRFDLEQLLIRFRPILDDVIRQMAKSTPFADRKSAAEEALCAAAQDYQPGYGDLEAYLENRVKLTLRAENKQYAAAFNQRSLDQPLSGGEADSFCLYDTISSTDSGWEDALDSQMDAERFCGSLSPRQQSLIRMLQDGFHISEVADILDVSEDDVRHMSYEIAKRRRAFEGAS